MARRIDPRQFNFARRMRKEWTSTETMLGGRPRSSDYFSAAKGLSVEVEPDTHDVERDSIRDRRFAQEGCSAMVFSNSDAAENIGGVLNGIVLQVQALPHRFTHPLIPFLEREGKV
jgi:very-short-patch-repair endonuclease